MVAFVVLAPSRPMTLTPTPDSISRMTLLVTATVWVPLPLETIRTPLPPLLEPESGTAALPMWLPEMLPCRVPVEGSARLTLIALPPALRSGLAAVPLLTTS